MVRVLLVLLPLLLFATGCQQPPQKPKPAPAVPVKQPEPEFSSEHERLVWLLGSPSFTKRRAAHNKLFTMGKEIIPALEKAAGNTANEDHRRQIQLLIADLGSRKSKEEKKDILVSLSIGKKSFELKNKIVVTLEIKNTGNVPLQISVPLLRMHSVGFRVDWRADMSFVSEGKKQPFFASGTKRDTLLKDKAWNPTSSTVKPGESLKEDIDITDLCTRTASYTATATYRWKSVGDFLSNAVTFEATKPPEPEEEPKK
jgi:hypothetical protein